MKNNLLKRNLGLDMLTLYSTNTRDDIEIIKDQHFFSQTRLFCVMDHANFGNSDIGDIIDEVDRTGACPVDAKGKPLTDLSKDLECKWQIWEDCRVERITIPDGPSITIKSDCIYTAVYQGCDSTGGIDPANNNPGGTIIITWDPDPCDHPEKEDPKDEDETDPRGGGDFNGDEGGKNNSDDDRNSNNHNGDCDEEEPDDSECIDATSSLTTIDEIFDLEVDIECKLNFLRIHENLSQCEIDYVLDQPTTGLSVLTMNILLNGLIADSESKDLFGNKISGGSCGDAYKHTLWMAYSARAVYSDASLLSGVDAQTLGSFTEDLVRGFGEARENCPSSTNTIHEAKMDLFNNNHGINIGISAAQGTLGSNMSEAVCTDLKNGNLSVILEAGSKFFEDELVPSNHENFSCQCPD